MSQTTLHQVSYRHVLVQGTAYAAGRAQGETMARNPEAIRFFTSPFHAKGPLSAAQVEAALRFFERHCPGLNEELQGFAEAGTWPRGIGSPGA
jgi:hypothetical protein